MSDCERISGKWKSESRSGESVGPEWLSVIPKHDARQRPSAMARTPIAAAPQGETFIKIKAVMPRFPESDEEALQLQEELERMGCSQLMHWPWSLKSKHMLWELRVGSPNQFGGTLRARPNQWTSIAWRKTHKFGPDGNRNEICARNEDFTQGRISSLVRTKNGYLTADCKNPRARRVLEFLVPILLPDKGARVTIGVASTILG